MIDIAGPRLLYAENPKGNPVTPDPASNLGETLEQASTSLHELGLEICPTTSRTCVPNLVEAHTFRSSAVSRHSIRWLESLEIA